jgi:diacylglycerol O-acyltransferase
MKPVAMMDAGFLLGERRNQPMHVGGLMLVTPPRRSKRFVAEAKVRALKHAHAQPPFNQKLVKRGGVWFWTEDTEFDLESHFHHMSLPAPGRIRELLALVSKLHSNLMDRTKPLWEVYLIDGLEDGRIALYSKIHHALVDGIAAMRLLQKATADSEDVEIIPIWALPPKRRREDNEAVKANPYTALMQAASVLRGNARSVPKVASEVLKSLRARRSDPDYVSVFQAPRTIFNQRISGARRFAAQSFSLARIKAAGKKHQATLNDAVLAMCASALRRYLMDLDALPKKPLVAMIPMSLRRDDSEGGNQIAMVLANLATHIADPLERLDAIVRSIQNSKERFGRMSQGEILSYLGVIMAAHGVNMALGINPGWQAFNLVISNVPGPKEVRYWNGARVDGLYPVSIVIDGSALNITLNSYAENLEFGLIACRRTLPHMQKLLQYLEEGLAELE